MLNQQIKHFDGKYTIDSRMESYSQEPLPKDHRHPAQGNERDHPEERKLHQILSPESLN